MKRIDRNQPEIVKALRKVGASVQSLAELGRGVPDLLVAYKGVWYLMEVKDGLQPESRRRLTEDEQNWHDSVRAKVSIVKSVDEALAVIGAVK